MPIVLFALFTALAIALGVGSARTGRKHLAEALLFCALVSAAAAMTALLSVIPS